MRSRSAVKTAFGLEGDVFVVEDFIGRVGRPFVFQNDNRLSKGLSS